MLNKILIVICVAVFTISLPTYNLSANSHENEFQNQEGLKLGDDAPDFSLTASDGQTYKLSDFRGKTVVMDFWATWCAPCKKKMPKIQELHDLYSEDGVEVLGMLAMNEGAEDRAKKYFSDKGYSFKLIYGNKQLTSDYGLKFLPTVIVVNGDGKIVYLTTKPNPNEFDDIKKIIEANKGGTAPAATPEVNEDGVKTTNFPAMRTMVNTEIPGAITLSQPQLITGTVQEIRTEKHGLVYPAFFDWNKDGKKDLMLGEFETGETGSYVKVYLNEGADAAPSYTGEYFYATDINGDTITNYQWCCIGIHPRIVDLDGDGYEDILSGQYNPGAISWWRGSEKGFLPRVFVEQEEYRDTRELDNKDAPWLPTSNSYWNYTTSDFADFNGDGLLDLFVGGSGDMRVALNEGTKENPKFGLRNYLHHIDGNILYVKKPKQEEIDETRAQGRYISMAGVWKTYIKPMDWDGDGVLDLLVTYEFKKEGHNPIDFYRGVNTNEGLRFEKRKPLITEANGQKALPGVQPMITVVDYNEDGVNDIVFGLSIPTINGFEVADEVAWAWAGDLEIEMPGKDAGRQIEYYEGGIEGIKERFKKDPFMKKFMLGKLEDEKYLTMRHRGYVFVMYGTAPVTKAKAKKVKAKPAVKREIIKNEIVKVSNIDGPVSYSAKAPEKLRFRKEFTAEATITFDKKWHGYVDNAANKKEGFIPTTVTFEFPKGLEPVGEVIAPEETYKGLAKVYKGDATFSQKFILKRPETREEFANLPKDFEIKAIITFQTCDDNICLPPQTHEVIIKSNVNLY